MIAEDFQTELRALIDRAPSDLSPEVLRLLERACDWLDDGPCVYCGAYHEDGSC